MTEDLPVSEYIESSRDLTHGEDAMLKKGDVWGVVESIKKDANDNGINLIASALHISLNEEILVQLVKVTNR